MAPEGRWEGAPGCAGSCPGSHLGQLRGTRGTRCVQQTELQAPVGFIRSREWGLFPVPEKVPRDHRGDTGRRHLAGRASSLSLSSQLPGWKAEGMTSQPWLSSWRGQGVHLELLTPHLLTDSQQLKTGERCRWWGVGNTSTQWKPLSSQGCGGHLGPGAALHTPGDVSGSPQGLGGHVLSIQSPNCISFQLEPPNLSCFQAVLLDSPSHTKGNEGKHAMDKTTLQVSEHHTCHLG